ncbi:MAG: hypothetical protein QM535_16870 [Limnohabitans sp.]|nr:hypothetical protein [Limnohabitans sp.]
MKKVIYLYFFSLFSVLATFSQSNKKIEEIRQKFDKSRINRNKINNSLNSKQNYLTTNELIEYINISSKIKKKEVYGKPFSNLDFDKIIAYDFEGSEEPYPDVIDKNGNFVPTILKQKALTQEEADKILKILTSNSTYGDTTAGCFNPHFAIVFYKNSKKINQINICLGCNFLSSEINIPAQTHRKINKGTANEYAIIGFTKLGKKGIIDLCKELEFTYGKTKI